MQDERPLALAVVVACAIGLFSVLLTELVLRSGASRRLASAVPPELKCLVSGLLSGLGLLVMLPLALDQLTATGWPYEHILLAFLAGPLATFFVNYVMLDHQHADDPSAAPHSHGRRSDGTQILCGQATPAKFTFGGAPQLVCQVSGRSPEVLAEEESAGAAWADKLSVVCGAVPFTIHAAVDGSILGTAHSPVLLASLALPITLCAVQDVATIVLTLSASRASRRAILASAACFGAGFPIGAGLLAALASSPSAARAALALPAVAAGLFLYMAVFEFAPPHAHGRKASLAQWLAFSSGVALAYATEALERWAEAAAVGAAARADLEATRRAGNSTGADFGADFGAGGFAESGFAAEARRAEAGVAALMLVGALGVALACFWRPGRGAGRAGRRASRAMARRVTSAGEAAAAAARRLRMSTKRRVRLAKEGEGESNALAMSVEEV